MNDPHLGWAPRFVRAADISKALYWIIGYDFTGSYIGDMTVVACTVRRTLLAMTRGHAGPCDRGIQMWMKCERFIEESPARYGFRNCTAALRGVAGGYLERSATGGQRKVSERSALVD